MTVTGWTYWNDDRYLTIDDMTNEEFHEAREAVKNEIKAKGYKISGASHQYINYCTPIIDNKFLYGVSMRSWGAIMQEAYDIPNDNGYGYVVWAWTHPDKEKEIFPKGDAQ